MFHETCYLHSVPRAGWSFLTNHARALLFISSNPDARLRDIAAGMGVTERTAYGIVLDLSEAGYVVKERDGRRNRYLVQTHLPLRDPLSRQGTVKELLQLLGMPTARTQDRAQRQH